MHNYYENFDPTTNTNIPKCADHCGTMTAIPGGVVGGIGGAMATFGSTSGAVQFCGFLIMPAGGVLGAAMGYLCGYGSVYSAAVLCKGAVYCTESSVETCKTTANATLNPCVSSYNNYCCPQTDTTPSTNNSMSTPILKAMK